MNKYFLFLLLHIPCCVDAQKATARIDHMAIPVKNLNNSIAFYDSLFAFDTIANPFTGSKVRWYLLGAGVQFHLIEMPAKVMNNDLFQHLCISIGSIDDFIATLKKKNIPYYNAQHELNGINTRGDGVKQLFIQDPDGYWIEVNNNAHH